MNSPILNSCLVIGTTVAALIGVFHPRMVNSVTWRATVTPLASIIGSGFLVLAPILKHSFGPWGIAVMLALCVGAYWIGGAIRFNIARYSYYGRQGLAVPRLVSRLEVVASYLLVAAYGISITYYLNLFGAFSVSLTTANDQLHARLVTTGAIVLIAMIGWVRGFAGLERAEEGTVGLKLGIIAGLLVGLLAFSVEQWGAIDGSYFASSQPLNWQSITVAMGLMVTVQGFETSRYLGDEFDVATRIRTMRIAQWISSAIYLLYIAITTFCFTELQVGKSETAIVGMTELVAPVLPVMLVAAALAAQFSAAVADTAGCGGLASETTHHKLNARVTYVLVGVFGIGLTWWANIYAIIAIASRAFAAYYAIQCAIAAVFEARSEASNRLRVAGYLVLATVAALIVVFGRAVE